jgi:NAD kinase
MEGKRQINSETNFRKPLVIYKINNDKAFIYTLKIIEYLLHNNNVEEIYIEDKEINIENIIKHRDANNYFSNGFTEPCEEIELNKHKLKNFELGITNPDLCICLGGDGTTLWCNNLFKNYDRPPFLTFNLGTLGYMAIYSNNLYKEVLDELYSTNKVISLEKRTMLNCKMNNIKMETKLQRWQSDCSIIG